MEQIAGSGAKFKVLGIWIGFSSYTKMKREGISRYIFYLVKHLIKNYNIKCEIWTYAINRLEVEALFFDLKSDVKFYSNFIEIHDDEEFFSQSVKSEYEIFKYYYNYNSLLFKNNSVSWKEPARLFKCKIDVSGRKSYLSIVFYSLLVFKGIVDKIIFKMGLYKPKNSLIYMEEPLVYVANKYSKADCFLIPIYSLVNALGLNRIKIMALHDLVIYDFYDLFCEDWEHKYLNHFIEQFDSTIKSISSYLLHSKIFFISNCNYVRKNHTLKYIKHVKAELTDYVYLPVIIPDNIDNRIMSEAALKKKYNINSRYIFFPTQIRPYKNVITLLKSLKLLHDKEYEIKLVLTGKLNDSKIASKYASENNLWNNIIETGDVPEEDLYSLHKYAVATVVTSLFEGGFPWPALEAMYMNTPAIIAKIEPAVERIEALGYKIENSGLLFFEPMDYKSLAEHIEYVICNREKIVYEQRNIKNVLLNYTWDDVSKQYYNIIDKFILNN